MANGNILKYGILRCRELVELYYGARMVVSITENSNNLSNAAPQQILGQDPRRIRYEIIVTNAGAAAIVFWLNASQDAVANIASQYTVGAGRSIVIERDFLTDLDAVTVPVWGQANSGGLTVSTRETFLTPAPVDEGP
jgi:hypothetical protein